MRQETAESILVTGWKGLQPDVVQPEPESCKAAKNFVLDEVAGELHMRAGIDDLFATEKDPTLSPTYPAMGALDQPEILWMESFYVPKEGGALVRLVCMKYRKQVFSAAASYMYSCGLWARPYWDGSAWVDSWRELTEWWEFKVYEHVDGTGATGSAPRVWLRLDTQPYTWDFGADGNGVFPEHLDATANQNYFRGWTIENIDADEKVGFTRALETRLFEVIPATRVLEMRIPGQAIGTPGDQPFDDLGWSNNDRIRVWRNWFHKHSWLSAADDIILDVFGYTVSDGMRITNGIGVNKQRVRVGWERRQVSTQFPNEHVADGLIVSDQCYDPREATAFPSVIAVQGAGGGTALPAGTYYAKYAVRKGSNWSQLRNVPINSAGKHDATLTDIVVAAGEIINLTVFLNVAIMPRDLFTMRLYLSDDNLYWYAVKDVDLKNFPGSLERPDDPYWDGTNDWEGWYAKDDDVFITGDEWAARGAEGSADIGRGIDDAGLLYYRVASAIGPRVVFGDVLLGEERFTNRMYFNAISGAGAHQIDVAPDNDVQYVKAGPDEGLVIAAIASFPDRALLLTDNGLILVTMLGAVGQWRFDELARDDGIASRESLVVIDRAAYWIGQSGVWVYSLTGGRRLLNPGWIKTFRDLANKALAQGGFDVLTGRYVLHLDGQEYIFPTRQPADPIDVLPGQFSKAPVHITKSPEDRLIYVGADNTLIEFGTATRDYGGGNITSEFESNQFRCPDSARQDMVLNGFSQEYESDLPVTVEFLLEHSGTVFDTKTLAAGNKLERRKFKLGSVGKGFRVRYRVVTTADGQAVRIGRLIVHRSLVETGGDQAVWD